MPRSPNALTTASGRPAAFGTRVRERIDSSRIVKRLQATALGEDEMTSGELQAARILLDRTVPVLKALEVNTGDDVNVKTITNAQLLDVIEGQAERK